MDCYDAILKNYEAQLEIEKSRVWIGKILIKLMDDFTQDTSDQLRIRNCLILLVNLFFNVNGPDHYHKKGKGIADLSKEEKAQFDEMLKSVTPLQVIE